MRIAMFSHSPHLCGAEKMLLNMARELTRLPDVRCLIVVPGDGALGTACREAGLTVAAVSSHVPWHLHCSPDAAGFGLYLGVSQRAAIETQSILRDWGADVLVVNTTVNLTGVLAAAYLNLPTCVWVHGIIDSGLADFSAGGLMHAMTEAIVRSATLLVCPSRWTQEYYRRLWGVSPAVVPNFTAIPDRPASAGGGPTQFCSLHTLEAFKGGGTLLEAARLLSARRNDFLLSMYGMGPMADEYRGFITRHGLQERVRLCGFTSDPSGVYSRSHALVSASAIESFGMTLVEAMAYGLPLVVSNTSGHREILEEGDWGFYCPVGDAAAFADRMEWIMDHPKEAAQMGQRGRDVATAKFSGRQSANAMYALLENVVRAEGMAPTREVVDRYDRLRVYMNIGKGPSSLPPSPGSPDASRSPVNVAHLQPLLATPHSEDIRPAVPSVSCLSVYVGTHMRQARGTLHLRLMHAASRRILREAQIDLSSVTDNSLVTFRFPTLHNTANTTLRAHIFAASDGPIALYAWPRGRPSLWRRVVRRALRRRPVLYVFAH